MNGGRREHFWGLKKKFGDNPGDSKIALDLGKRLRQSERRTGQRTPNGTRGSPRHGRRKPARVEVGRGGKVAVATRRKRIRSGVRPQLRKCHGATRDMETACRRRRDGQPERGRRQVEDAESGDRSVRIGCVGETEPGSPGTVRAGKGNRPPERELRRAIGIAWNEG